MKLVVLLSVILSSCSYDSAKDGYELNGIKTPVDIKKEEMNGRSTNQINTWSLIHSRMAGKLNEKAKK